MGNGDSDLGMSGRGKSSLKAGGAADVAPGTSGTGRGAVRPVGVLSPEVDGSSGLATISLPGVCISNTDRDSDERRSSGSGPTEWPASIEGGGIRLRGSADFDRRDEVRWRGPGV